MFLLYIGFRYRSKDLSFKYKDEAPIKPWMIIATIFISSIGTGTTVGLMQKVFETNMAYVYGILIAVLFDIILGLKLIPKLVKYHKDISVGDLFKHSYGIFGKRMAGISSIIISIGYIAVQISVSGYVFEYLLNVSKLYGILLSYGVITIYASFGGFKAIMYTNFVQFFGIIIGIPLITVSLLKNHPVDLSVYKYKYVIDKDIMFHSLAIALNFSVSMLTPNFIQRTLISNNPKILKSALLKKSVIYAFYVVLIGINGLLFFIQYHELGFANLRHEEISNQFQDLFIGIKGLIAVGLLAAATSTADSDLNIISISLYKDLYQTYIKKQNAYDLIIIKLTTVLISLLSIFIALKFENILDIIMFSSAFWAPITFVPLVASLYGRTITINQLKINSLFTIIFCISWQYFFPNTYFKPMFSGVIFNLILFICFYRSNLNNKAPVHKIE